MGKRMLIGRAAELEYLKGYYEKEGSHLLILYGQKSIGKTAILREFTRGKPCHYHMARACSGQGSLEWMQRLEDGKAGLGLEKEVVVVEEFQHMARTGKEAVQALLALSGKWSGGAGVLLILVSSSIRWVENKMVSQLGEAVSAISDVYKVKELEFRYLQEYFSLYSVRQCMEVYALLGGVPGWWKHFDQRRSVKGNICQAILEGTGGLRHTVEYLAMEELRELAVYNTILAALAAGKRKLNDLHKETGFPRAKLSVYLGNLIQMDWVEKVYSFEPSGSVGKKANAEAKKGMYRICNSYIDFYYTYLYYGEEQLFRMSAERFYNTYILPDRDRHLQEAFVRACMQHIETCGRQGKLPVREDRIGSWFGKDGRHIDAVVQETGGATLLALCQGSRFGMTYEEYAGMLATAQKAGFHADYVWLYAELFDCRIVKEAEERETLVLVDIREMSGLLSQ